MCGRYFLEPEISDEELQKIVEALNRRGGGAGAADAVGVADAVGAADAVGKVKCAGDVFPTDAAPALAGGKVLVMRWGFSKPDGKGVVINARSETAAERPMFRRALEGARCLLPASGYYEWGRDDRRRYAISRRRTIYMAGLYRQEWPGEMARFVILTRDASPAVAAIHDRMPVILDGPARRAWLDARVPAADVLREAVDDVESAPV